MSRQYFFYLFGNMRFLFQLYLQIFDFPQATGKVDSFISSLGKCFVSFIQLSSHFFSEESDREYFRQHEPWSSAQPLLCCGDTKQSQMTAREPAGPRTLKLHMSEHMVLVILKCLYCWAYKMHYLWAMVCPLTLQFESFESFLKVSQLQTIKTKCAFQIDCDLCCPECKKKISKCQKQFSVTHCFILISRTTIRYFSKNYVQTSHRSLYSCKHL